MALIITFKKTDRIERKMVLTTMILNLRTRPLQREVAARTED